MKIIVIKHEEKGITLGATDIETEASVLPVPLEISAQEQSCLLNYLEVPRFFHRPVLSKPLGRYVFIFCLPPKWMGIGPNGSHILFFKEYYRSREKFL